MMSINKEELIHSDSLKKYLSQLGLISKIIKGSLWLERQYFPDNLIHEISSFIFVNPITFRKQMFMLTNGNELVLNQKYFLMQTQRPTQKRLEITTNLEKQRQKQCGDLVLIKQWKPIALQENNYNQVIIKGKFLLNFLSNLKIKLSSQKEQEPQIDPFDVDNYKKYEKQKKKEHILIAAQENQVLRLINEILGYEKDKKLTPSVVKAFVYLSHQNMAIVRVEEHYPFKIQSQGRYLYIHNSRHLLITNRPSKQGMFGLSIADKKWKITKELGSDLQIYKPVQYPLPRRPVDLLTSQLQQVHLNDVWIK